MKKTFNTIGERCAFIYDAVEKVFENFESQVDEHGEYPSLAYSISNNVQNVLMKTLGVNPIVFKTWQEYPYGDFRLEADTPRTYDREYTWQRFTAIDFDIYDEWCAIMDNENEERLGLGYNLLLDWAEKNLRKN